MIDIDLMDYDEIEITDVSQLKSGMIVIGKYSRRFGFIEEVDYEEGEFSARLFPSYLSPEYQEEEWSGDWCFSTFNILEKKENNFWRI